MADRAAPAAIDPSDARRCHSRRRVYNPQSSVPAASDSSAPKRYETPPAALPRPLRDAENFGGEVSWRSLPWMPATNQPHSALMPADLMIGHHLAISAFW